MTPKEKAKSMISKFTFADIYFSDRVNGSKLNAKQCALIAVHEILEATKTEIDRPELCKTIYSSYWQQVKQEIEEL